MIKSITATCLDTMKKISVDVNGITLDTVLNTPSDTRENWDAYTDIHYTIKQCCEYNGITFWSASIEDESWSSEM